MSSSKRPNDSTPPSMPSKRRRRFISIQHQLYNFKSDVHSPHTQSMTTDEVIQKQRIQKELENILCHELQYATYEGDWVANYFCPASVEMIDRVIARLWKADIWEPSAANALSVDAMKTWPGNKSAEADFCEPFSTLLNNIIEAFKECYPTESEFSYLRHVRFTKYAKTMQESVAAEFVLKPDILALTKLLVKKRRASWYATIFAGEVKATWKKLILQAGAYAHCLFAATDHRIFIPIFILHNKSSTFRLCFYHRSGLLATHAMQLTTASGLKDLVSTIVGMWLWRSPSQAGYVPTQLPTYLSFNNTKYFIHHVVCRRQAIRGRVTTVYVVSRDEVPEHATRYLAAPRADCGGEEWKCLNPFDVNRDQQPEELDEYEEDGDENGEDEDDESDGDEEGDEGAGSHEDDCVVTTQELILPDPLPDSFIVECSHQHLGRETEVEVFKAVQGFIGIPDIIAEYDALGFVIPADKTPTPWRVLINAKQKSAKNAAYFHTKLTFKQVGYALHYAMIGHCALFTVGGYLHRDISNGNIIRLVHTTQSDWKIPPVLRDIVTSNECTAVLIDGDVAKKWGTPAQASDRSGTLPFISARLVDAWAKDKEIVHTPIDDLESFAWVLFYDALAWTPASERTTTEDAWWTGLNSEDLLSLANVKVRILAVDWGSSIVDLDDNLSGILDRFRPLIHGWFAKADEYSTLFKQFLREQRDEKEFIRLYNDAYEAFVTVGLEQCAELPDIPIKSVHEN